MRECRNWNNGQVCYRSTGSAPVTVNLVGAGNCDSAFKELIGFNQNMDALDMSTATQLGGFVMWCMAFNNGQAAGGTTAPLLWSAARSSHFQYMFADCYLFNQDISTLLDDFAGADLTFSASGGTVTITRVGHGLSSGSVTILGSSDTGLLPNGTYTIANVTTDTFTVTAGSGTGNGTALLGSRMDWMFRNASAFKRDVGTWNVSAAVNFTDMFNGCNINEAGTTTNYDNLLTGWASRPVVSDRSFNGGTSKYGADAVNDRDILRNAPNNWTITDGGQYVP
jgi:hypothetical protein